MNGNLSSIRPERPETWLTVTESGLYCLPGKFHVDPSRPVDNAVITHGHADHARPGHHSVLATQETLAIMQSRFSENAAGNSQALRYGQELKINDVTVSLAPAGHVLGSAQVKIDFHGYTAVISGDYKRQPDPTCPAFEVIPCDLFVTEATFALPVFRHPVADEQVEKLLRTQRTFQDRTVLVGAYALGKAQRLISLIRNTGYDRPLFLHGALQKICKIYEGFGQEFGALQPVAGVDQKSLAGEMVLAPPSALTGRWANAFPDPIRAFASGWMSIRQRARQRGIELPLVLSDHADWSGLTQSILETGAERVWVTHGREDALVHYLQTQGIDADALSLVGFDEDDS